MLELVAKKDTPITMTEICRELGLPKSSAFELVYTLVDKGFLEYADTNLRTFKLGIRLFQVGVSYLAKTSLHAEAKTILERLMLASGMTVFLAVEHQGRLVYLDKIEPPNQSIRIDVHLGSSNPMHCTGLGKALLAAYGDETVRQMIGTGSLPMKTACSIASYDKLAEELKKIRARGYAIDNMENELNIVCLAAPIYDRANKPVAAISVRSLASEIDQTRIETLSGLVTHSALEISQRLGYLKDRLYFQ